MDTGVPGGVPAFERAEADGDTHEMAASGSFDIVAIRSSVLAFTGGGKGRIAMSVNASGRAEFRQRGVRARNWVSLHLAQPVEIRLHGFECLWVAAADLQQWQVAFTGIGQVNITGVEFLQARFDGGAVHAPDVRPDIGHILQRIGDRVTVLVNGSIADFIKCDWLRLEKAVLRDARQAAGCRDCNSGVARIELALKYVAYLKEGGQALVMEDADHIRLKDDGMLFGGFGDELDECVGPVVSQTTVSVGSGVMRRLLGEYAEERDGRRYGPAVFDVRLEAFDGAGALLVDNRIRIRVCHHLGSSV